MRLYTILAFEHYFLETGPSQNSRNCFQLVMFMYFCLQFHFNSNWNNVRPKSCCRTSFPLNLYDKKNVHKIFTRKKSKLLMKKFLLLKESISVLIGCIV